MVEDSIFLKSLKGEKIPRFPVWLMRQAGRYMPQYRQLRAKARDFLDFCQNPTLATEVTLLPEKLLGVDALILFSDILVPLIPLGVDVKFLPQKGPVLTAPPPEEWKDFEPSEVEYVFETIKRVKNLSEKPLIGFSGAPYTLAAYILEGETSRDFREIRKLYYQNREKFHFILSKLTQMLKTYLSEQIKAGADALQIFDSWAYTMSPQMFAEYLPYVEDIAQFLKEEAPQTPIIYFFRGSGHLYQIAGQKLKSVDCFSIDWTLRIEKALEGFKNKAIQGNLDPTVLYADKKTIERSVIELLTEVSKNRKTLYVFNLGHGLAPDMEMEKVKHLVDTVKSFYL
jgi:uroporphyrinogen decarboxylase